MRAIITTMGSVEDLPPFVALAIGLRREGNDCHFALPGNLIEYVKRHGFAATQLGPDEIGELYHEAELDLHKGRIDSPAVERYSHALEDAGIEAFTALADLCSGAELLVGSISMPLGLIVHELTGARYVALQTHNPTELIETPNELATFRHQLGLPTTTGPGPMGISPSYGFSPELNLVATSPMVLNVMFDQPLSWPAHCHATGFLYEPQDETYQPDDLVREFVDAVPIVVAFGTRNRAERDALIALHGAAARMAGRRLVCRDAWGTDMGRRVSSDVLILGNGVPEHWLFERAACLIHDADGGVTASALRSGVPSVPIPSDPSLFGWARASYNLGCSPQIIRYEDLDSTVLANAIKLAVNDTSVRHRSSSIREHLLAEGGVKRAVTLITTHINTCTAVHLPTTPP
jgi:sterol 3beta-glucosyltransferase